MVKGSGSVLTDFRSFRPASLLVIDLVKHSQRDKEDVYTVQALLSQVLTRSIERLQAQDVHFNHTGDGYVCAFLGDSSARIMDFLNVAFPELRHRLTEQNQQLRAGLDFGLIHLTPSNLTGGLRHFFQPGIRAARLEAAAKPDQILCTNTFYQVFAPHYPHMFPKLMIQVGTKDRIIDAYEVVIAERDIVTRYFADFLYRKPVPTPVGTTERRCILVIDDDRSMLESFKMLLENEFPEYSVMISENVTDALSKFAEGKFSLVITDNVMIYKDDSYDSNSGVQLTRELTELDSQQVVVMLTGYPIEKVACQFLANGGFYFAGKGDGIHDLIRVLKWSTRCGHLLDIRRKIHMLADDLGLLLWKLQQSADCFHLILKKTSESSDLGHILLRHKAKRIVSDFLDSVTPGTELMKPMKLMVGQLRCVCRLAATLKRMQLGETKHFLEEYVGDMNKRFNDLAIKLSFNESSNTHTWIQQETLVLLIICELVDNAIDAVDRRGKVDVLVTELPSVGLLQIKVKDSGQGVPLHLQDQIFDPGVSTKDDDRGFGLSLVAETVRRLQGRIEYSFDKGALFFLEIPLKEG